MNEALETMVFEAQGGNKETMEKIFIQFYPFIKKSSLHIYIKNYEVEDLIQIGNLSLLKAILKYKKGTKAHFVTYATTAIKNNYYSEIKMQSRYNYEYSLDRKGEEDISLVDLLPSEEAVEDHLFEMEDRRELKEFLDELSLEEKEMIHYLYFVKESLPTYAASINKPYQTCLKKKKILLEKLREMLERKRKK